jgi:hypothetical protein
MSALLCVLQIVLALTFLPLGVLSQCCVAQLVLGFGRWLSKGDVRAGG